MADCKFDSTSPISIGNCMVEIEGNGFVVKSTAENLEISSSDGSRIKISVDRPRRYTTRRSRNSSLSSLESGVRECSALEGYAFLLVNPKDVDSHTKSLLQEIRKIYMKELPTMNYAANTGKESSFLERCISSGKYRTLVLRSNSVNGLGEVIAAVSYQIISADTQYAEIPLAACSLKNQNKGIGRLLYNELRERLRSVGILSIFCWADKESEGFWLKQGFISIGEIDSKGKRRRLPIKSDIRRALCFPGGSTLMVTHLSKDTVASISSSECVNECRLMSHAKPPSDVSKRISLLENSTKEEPKKTSPDNHIINISRWQTENTLTQRLVGNRNSAQDVSPGAGGLPWCEKLVLSNSLSNGGNESESNAVGMAGNGNDIDSKHCPSGQTVKKRVWKASLSSLKSKRVRGGQLVNSFQDDKNDIACYDVHKNDYAVDNCSLDTYKYRLTLNAIPKDPDGLTSEINSKDKRSECGVKKNGPRIMLMNIADDAKKTCLTKIIEELGGSISCSGSTCSHVITGKARRTLNFCTALCAGAWIVSPNWLKASFREGKFLGESEFLLEDEEYRLKYKSELRDAVVRAKEGPHSLLRGYDVCLAVHIQPSVKDLSAIIKSAGGNVIRRLDNMVDPSRTIFIVCDEEMEEAMTAAKGGVRTFSSDWLMGCVMKQELDFEATQFAESL